MNIPSIMTVVCVYWMVWSSSLHVQNTMHGQIIVLCKKDTNTADLDCNTLEFEMPHCYSAS